ncbi:MAG: anti-sigma factor antagonist [Pseudonocardiales bacterium]|jgi:anti-sigma B factor antagonist|nr:anti-sigma factor antagonist [Pseudonocardiales bacterium]
MDLDLSASEDGGRAVLTLVGAVDVESRAQVQSACQRLLNDGPVGLVIDMSGVTFIDSTGIGALVEVAHNAQDLGITFTIRRPSTRVQRIIQVTGLADVWDIEGDTESR